MWSRVRAAVPGSLAVALGAIGPSVQVDGDTVTRPWVAIGAVVVLLGIVLHAVRVPVGGPRWWPVPVAAVLAVAAVAGGPGSATGVVGVVGLLVLAVATPGLLVASDAGTDSRGVLATLVALVLVVPAGMVGIGAGYVLGAVASVLGDVVGTTVAAVVAVTVTTVLAVAGASLVAGNRATTSGERRVPP